MKEFDLISNILIYTLNKNYKVENSFHNETCRNSDQCQYDSGLVCTKGVCVCANSNFFWNGTYCGNF